MTLSDFLRYLNYAKQVAILLSATVDVATQAAKADPNQPETPLADKPNF
jgi:hypothetical protein